MVDFPIVIEQNSFQNNMAQAFGSSLAIVNYERDYVTMDCTGIYLKDNNFTDNIMCPNAVGNVIIACIPEKISKSPLFSGTSSSSVYREASSWIRYNPSVNQETNSSNNDFDTITQIVFTKFVRNITENKGN